jgi:hypothetical protein
MAKCKASRIENMREISITLVDFPEYQKVLRFGDETIKSTLQSYNIKIKQKVAKYERGMELLNQAQSIDDCNEAMKLLSELGNFEGAEEGIALCIKKAGSIKEEQRAIKEKKEAEERSKRYRQSNRCQYCGNRFTFIPMLGDFCGKCGKKKDY